MFLLPINHSGSLCSNPKEIQYSTMLTACTHDVLVETLFQYLKYCCHLNLFTFADFRQSFGMFSVDQHCANGHHLSLDDVEEEVRVAAAAEEVSQTERLVEAFHLLLDLRRRSTRRTPKHKQNHQFIIQSHSCKNTSVSDFITSTTNKKRTMTSYVF